MRYRRHFSLRHVVPREAVAQRVPLPGQIPNNAGGHWYAVDDAVRLDRFLLLGSEGGTYHVGERALTADNAVAVLRCIAADGPRTVLRTVEISRAGRAPRTGTHILTFADMVEGFRGWGRGLRRGVAGWFTDQDPERLALQAVKYMNRGGWSLRDLLRLAHPVTDRPESRILFDWIAHPAQADAVAAARATFPLVDGLYRIREAGGPAEAAAIVRDRKLPREAVPTELLNEPAIWEALLPDMPPGALVRNLGRLSQIGLLANGSPAAAEVVRRLGDAEAIARARVHPVRLLLAQKIYAQGHGALGRLNWSPMPAVVDALDEAFDSAFAAIRPTGRRILLGVDVSGSMHGTRCAGSPALSALEAAAAVAMTFVRTEPQAEVVAFDTALHAVSLSPRQRLDDVLRLFRQWNGGTDIALPIRHARERRSPVDALVTITDNETWAGREHPVQALARYRESVNPQARAVVLATAANAGSVVPDGDPLSLGCAGFDAAVPQLVGAFIEGGRELR